MPPLENYAVVVVDTLRATTTMATILERGAKGVLPVADVDEAFSLRSQNPHILLGGERHNRPLPGFDAGNSPFDYAETMVQDRLVVLSTTNGTQAVKRVKDASWLALGALVNARACFEAQIQAEEKGLVVCAGTEGQIALEDVLAAGAIVSYWPTSLRGDGAHLACALYNRWQHDLAQGIRLASHAKTLIDQGLEQDVDFAAALNIYSQVPVRQDTNWFAYP